MTIQSVSATAIILAELVRTIIRENRKKSRQETGKPNSDVKQKSTITKEMKYARPKI